MEGTSRLDAFVKILLRYTFANWVPKDAVSSTSVHRSGSVVMTCSGHRHPPQELSITESSYVPLETEVSDSAFPKRGLAGSLQQTRLTDSSLRLWSLM